MLLHNINTTATIISVTNTSDGVAGGMMLIRIIAITVIALVGKFIENGKKFILTGNNILEGNIHSFYECWNIHLSLCLGVLGLVWASNKEPITLITIFILILLGIGTKGIFSNHKPDRLALSDRDALWGLYLPNSFAFSAVLYGTIILW